MANVSAPRTMVGTEPMSPGRSRRPLLGNDALQAEKNFPFDFENMRNTLVEDNHHHLEVSSRKAPLLLSPDDPDQIPTSPSCTSTVALLDEKKRVSSPTSPNLRMHRHSFKMPSSPPPYSSVVPASGGGLPLPQDSHQTLRATHSWDPNRLPDPKDKHERMHLSAPSSRVILYRQESDDEPIHVQKLKLRNTNSLPSEPKPRLRPVRSFDTYSDQDCDHLHPHNNNNTIAPSPATKRRLNYLQKLAASMRSAAGGSRSSSPSGSRRSTVSSSQDLDSSPCPSSGPSTPDFASSDEGGFDAFLPNSPPCSPSVMHKGRLSTSPGSHAHGGSSKFIPRKIWRSKSKSSHQSSGHHTSLWYPEVSLIYK